MEPQVDHLLILKTNILSKQMVRPLVQVLDSHEGIYDWSIDLEDIDKVLRIEAKRQLQLQEVIQLIATYGFSVEELN